MRSRGAGEAAEHWHDGAGPARAPQQRRHARAIRLARDRRDGDRRSRPDRHASEGNADRQADDHGGLERHAPRRGAARDRGRGHAADDEG